MTSSLPKSFSIDDASFILLCSLYLLFSHPTVFVSGDPLQDCAHSFTMIWPIWCDLVHCATSLHTVHATPHCAYPRALWAQHVPQTGNKSNDCRGSQQKGPQCVVVAVVVVRQTIKMEWTNRRLSTPATTTTTTATKRERVRNGNKVALNCERLMRQEFHRQRHKLRLRQRLRQRQSRRQVSGVRCQMSKQWAKV